MKQYNLVKYASKKHPSEFVPWNKFLGTNSKELLCSIRFYTLMACAYYVGATENDQD
jgi:hypothetical protein